MVGSDLADDPVGPPPATLLGVPLEGAYEPFTSSIDFVEAPFDAVVEARRRWTSKLPDGGNVLR